MNACLDLARDEFVNDDLGKQKLRFFVLCFGFLPLDDIGGGLAELNVSGRSWSRSPRS
jgi:hypothetical protein